MYDKDIRLNIFITEIFYVETLKLIIPEMYDDEAHRHSQQIIKSWRLAHRQSSKWDNYLRRIDVSVDDLGLTIVSKTSFLP